MARYCDALRQEPEIFRGCRPDPLLDDVAENLLTTLSSEVFAEAFAEVFAEVFADHRPAAMQSSGVLRGSGT